MGADDDGGVLQDTLGSRDDGYAHAEARALLNHLLGGCRHARVLSCDCALNTTSRHHALT